MKILVINGPNINMLGIREPQIYGKENYKTLCDSIENHAAQKGIEVKRPRLVIIKAAEFTVLIPTAADIQRIEKIKSLLKHFLRTRIHKTKAL